MALQDRLNAFRAAFESGHPPHSVPRPVIEQMDRATAELAASGAPGRSLQPGDRAPDFRLDAAHGAKVALADLLRQGPVILTFYRGIWCPYCNIELQALELALPLFRARGVALVSISPQTIPNSRASVENNRLTYPILSDPANAVAESFGVSFRLPDYLIDTYQKLRTDLPMFNGDPSWTLPMPARFVIAPDGVIAYAEVGADYRQRPDPEELLPVLDRLRS